VRLRSVVARLCVRGIFALLFRIRVPKTLPSRGPLIVVANHQGWADAFLLAAAFPLRARIRFIGDRSATMTLWWKRLILRSVGLVIPIDRTRAQGDRRAIATTLSSLAAGDIVVIFAEGRVSHSEAALGPFARGVGYLAAATGAHVAPAWLAGTAELYLGRELTVSLGPPRAVAKGAPTKARTLEIARAVHGDLAALAQPWHEPATARKRWRWLTNLF
jgi:1-acyl-sn-glycerol-3-phosphate acyltransferase